jgi:CheY-like chemotaxis protein
LQVLVGMIEGGGHAALPEIGDADVWDALRDSSFDVVVTDLSMPSLDGLAVARWLQKYRPGIPVIAVSGDLADLEDIDGKSPFAAAIEKPLRRAALLAAIDAVLGGESA